MSDASDQFKELEEIAKEQLLKMLYEEFRELTPICTDRVVASGDDAFCAYYESSSTDCRFFACPRLDFPFDAASIRLKEELNP